MYTPMKPVPQPKVLNIFIIPKSFLMPLSDPSLQPLFPKQLQSYEFIYISWNFIYMEPYSTHFFGLASFTQHNYFKIHLCCMHRIHFCLLLSCSPLHGGFLKHFLKQDFQSSQEWKKSSHQLCMKVCKIDLSKIWNKCFTQVPTNQQSCLCCVYPND